MFQIDKNTVPAEKQLGNGIPVCFENKEGTGKRILFVGNSITLHEVKPEIGWFENHGMAASAKEKDYVHLVMKEVQKKDPDAGCCILQMAEWERKYQDNYNIDERCEQARTYNADVIIAKLGENVNRENYDEKKFIKEYKSMIDYLNLSGKARVIMMTGFWKHIANQGVLRVAQDCGYEVIHLEDLGEDDSMKAIGKFEHSGVANHPGDVGMKMISKRILETLWRVNERKS